MKRMIHVPIRSSLRVKATIDLHGGPDAYRPRRPWAVGYEICAHGIGGSSAPPMDGERWTNKNLALVAAAASIEKLLGNMIHAASCATARRRIEKAIQDVQQFADLRRTKTRKEKVMAATATKTRKKGRGTRGEGRGKGGTGKASGTRGGKASGTRAEGNGKPPLRRVVATAVEPLDLEVILIGYCPFQPRRDFPAAEIKALADSIAEQGQIHPIAVRRIALPPFFELVDGERRLRAVKLLGWKTIRAEVGEYSDAQVRSITLATALQRKELNAIEEATAFRAAIDAGDADGPTELARQLGLSQGHVSNRLRLLELPANVRAKVISREISASNARALVPLKEAKPVLDAVLKEIKNGDDGREMGTTEFLETIDNAVHSTCKRIETCSMNDYQHRVKIPPLKLTDQQRSELGILEHTPPWHGSKPQQYATNVDLYNKLHAEHVKAVIERAGKRAGKKGKGEKEEGRGKNGKPLSAAEKKRLEADQREKDKDRAAKLARGVWAMAIDWRRALIAEALRTEQVSPDDTYRLLLYFAAARTCSNERTGESHYHATAKRDKREEILGEQLKVRRRGGGYDLPFALANVEDRDVIDESQKFLAELFWGDDGPGQVIPDEDVLAITEQLAIDLPAAWKKDALGPLTERWLDLRNKEALRELAKTFGGPWRGMDFAKHSKAEIVEGMAKVLRGQKPPAELVKPKKPRG